MQNIEQAENNLFAIWDASACEKDSPAVLLVHCCADNLGECGDSALGYNGHSKYRLPPGWQPRDVAAALSDLVMDIADREGWPREKLIGLLMDECVQTATSLAPLGSREESESALSIAHGIEFLSKLIPKIGK